MSRRLLLLISALGALLALPAFAGAAMVYQSSGAITTKWEVSTDENDAYTSDVTSDGNLPIYMADDDGGNRIKLPVTGQFPVVSPNGAMVAYQKVTNPKTNTWTMNDVKALNPDVCALSLYQHKNIYIHLKIEYHSFFFHLE